MSPADRQDGALGLVQLPDGGEVALVLVGLGIAQHDLHDTGIVGHGGPGPFVRKQVVENPGRPAKVLDGLEERHDRREVRRRAHGVGEPRDTEHVAGRRRHREHEGSDRVGIGTALAEQLEQGDGLRRLVVQVDAPVGDLRTVDEAPVERAGRAAQRLDRPVDDGGVLPDVERRGTEPEARDEVAKGGDAARRDAFRADLPERLLQRPEVVGELVRSAVGHGLRAGAVDVRAQANRAGHAELAERLVGIAPNDPLRIAGGPKACLQALAEAIAGRPDVLADAQDPDELVQLRDVSLDGVVVMTAQRAPGHGRRDVRVAVAVTADPRAELQERGDVDPDFGKVASQGVGQAVSHVRGPLDEGLVEEMQPPGDLLVERRSLQAQLPGHPQQGDGVAQLADQLLAFARRPAVRLQLDELAVDPAMVLEDGDALRLRRVRRDRRRDLEMRQRLGQPGIARALARPRDRACDGRTRSPHRGRRRPRRAGSCECRRSPRRSRSAGTGYRPTGAP